jgi:hypothetical protein
MENKRQEGYWGYAMDKEKRDRKTTIYHRRKEIGGGMQPEEQWGVWIAILSTCYNPSISPSQKKEPYLHNPRDILSI